jgi:hypothetical protein
MENVGTGIGMGATGAAIIGVLALLFKWLHDKDIHCISGCCKLDIESDDARVHPSEKFNIKRKLYLVIIWR